MVTSEFVGDRPCTVGPGARRGPQRTPDTPALLSPFAAKLSRPRVPRAFVPRQRLTDALDAGSRLPVTLVSAGPGWGKTLLVASWAETGRAPGPVGWLSLDADDNTASTFWTNVVAALRATGAVRDSTGGPDRGRRPSTSPAFAERLTVALSQLVRPVVLVLDDLHLIDDPQILSDFSVLLRYQPDRLRLVLLSRADPALPLHRLRAAGQLAEIRATDLEFTADEATGLLDRHGLRLGPDEVQALLRRTEGWAAGLRLAASYLSERGNGQRTIATFTGDRGAVADYLIGEVLAYQRPEVRRFLLYTSVVDQLSGDLADALMRNGRSGQAMLEQLERTNAFVVGLGARPDWFHYHHLLRQLLRHLLLVEEPDMVRELHLRAAAWYAGHNAALKAVTHAAAAPDWALVGRLTVAALAPFLLSADREKLATVLRGIPTDQLPATAELRTCAGLLLFYAGDYEAIAGQVADARHLLAGRTEADRLPVEIAVGSLEVALARVRGDMPMLVEAATDVLRMLALIRLDELPSALQYRAIAINNKGVGLLWSGDLDRAEQYLRSAVTAARAAGVELVEVNAAGHLAFVEYLRGMLREAGQQAMLACERAERWGWSSALQAVPAHVARMLVELERYHVPEAEDLMKRAVAAHHADPESAQRILLLIAQTRLLLAKGKADAAAAVAGKIRPVGRPERARLLACWAAVTEAEAALAVGHPEQARARIGPIDDESPLAQRQRVCLARAELALGDLDRADDLLAPVRDAPTDVVAAVEAWIVTALLADSRRQAPRSVTAFARAILLAEPEGIRLPFVTIDRRRVAGLVERYRSVLPEPSRFAARLAAELSPARRRAGRPSFDELSTRELEVLRYLPTMYNAGEIGRELHVSVNTIKAHLRSIYRKLGVSRRRDAVGRARALGLIP